jgi:hypothetical protein
VDVSGLALGLVLAGDEGGAAVAPGWLDDGDADGVGDPHDATSAMTTDRTSVDEFERRMVTASDRHHRTPLPSRGIEPSVMGCGAGRWGVPPLGPRGVRWAYIRAAEGPAGVVPWS